MEEVLLVSGMILGWSMFIDVPTEAEKRGKRGSSNRNGDYSHLMQMSGDGSHAPAIEGPFGANFSSN